MLIASSEVAHRHGRAYQYDHVAWCYETIARLGSFGAIPRLKAVQLEWISADARVLYVGAGSGEDVVRAAARGLDVTALDRSPRMLRRLGARLERAELRARLVEDDLLVFPPKGSYDVVVANFFLNVFEPATVEAMLARCRQHLADGGRLLIGDFRPPGPGLWRRLGYNLYYAPLNLGAWLLGLCAIHPIYDYATWFETASFEVVERRAVGLWGNGALSPACYETIIARAI
ncbi:MAG: class I SAM-dependent methyltransferase [Myxococcota bacterium]|nr:class I SAM-dependent methyltransferase [Myxococcota bacterium]